MDLAATKPQQRDAVQRVAAAAELHQPSGLVAGEYNDGTCAFCQDTGNEPIKRFRDHLNGSRAKVWLHLHTDPYPTCTTCAGGGYDASFADWPCATAIALGVV